MKISQAQKQFLIVWFCIHAFALIVNIFEIQGEITAKDAPDTVMLFSQHSSSDFWPFVEFTDTGFNPKLFEGKTWTIFRGVFYGYDFSEFIVYAILGLAIVFLPQLWKQPTIKE